MGPSTSSWLEKITSIRSRRLTACISYVTGIMASPLTQIVISVILTINPRLGQEKTKEFVEALGWASCQYQVEPSILLAIAEVETAFHPQVGDGGASQGIMQVNYPAWKGIMPEGLWADRSTSGNVIASAWILRFWMDKCKVLGTCSLWWRHYQGGYSPNNPNALNWDRLFKKALRRWVSVLEQKL